MTSDDRLMTAREVAEQLAVTTETVLRWTRRGELPALKLPGGAIRYRRAAVEVWLDARATEASASGTRVSATRNPAALADLKSTPLT